MARRRLVLDLHPDQYNQLLSALSDYHVTRSDEAARETDGPTARYLRETAELTLEVQTMVQQQWSENILTPREENNR